MFKVRNLNRVYIILAAATVVLYTLYNCLVDFIPTDYIQKERVLGMIADGNTFCVFSLFTALLAWRKNAKLRRTKQVDRSDSSDLWETFSDEDAILFADFMICAFIIPLGILMITTETAGLAGFSIAACAIFFLCMIVLRRENSRPRFYTSIALMAFTMLTLHFYVSGESPFRMYPIVWGMFSAILAAISAYLCELICKRACRLVKIGATPDDRPFREVD